MSDRVAGKVAIVTGASRGVGRADAELLAAEGATVIMTDINAEAGEQAAAEIGGKVRFVKQDVSAEADWQSLIEMVEKEHGGLDILVNNAAILQFGDVTGETYEGWKRVQTINSDSVFLGIHYALPLMAKSGGGSIVNMSSSSALIGMPQFAAYSASKAAVRGLTQSVAVYCHQMGNKVRCNTIHPDGIATPMTMEIVEKNPVLVSDPAKSAVAGSYTCLPEDVAQTVLFLASDESRNINGAAITLDNSSTITPPYI